ncbi:hypothetical protein LTS10_004656 [Elasticomyces elasticus]|nr:hypothetical protein LTS10_004656 [Elasticomyces elasticus]
MAQANLPWTLVATSVAILGAVLVSKYLTAVKDPREPPYIPSSIPLVGHLIHLLREGAEYLTVIDRKYHHGIYTIPIFSQRLYVVNSPSWVVTMHKSHKTLSFNVLVVQAMRVVFGFGADEAAMKATEDNADNEQGDRSGLLMETHDMMFGAFVQQIDELNANFLKCWTPYVNALARHGEVSMPLWYWLRHNFSIASVASLYGPESPLTLDPSLEDDFWTFEAGVGSLFITPWPSIFLRKVYKARQRIFDALNVYAEKEGYKRPGTSRLVQARVEMTMGKYGLSKPLYGAGETGLFFAALVNTAGGTFWLLSHILADPVLHAEIRAEIDGCVPKREGTCIIDIAKLKAQCPLLNSAIRENLRITATMNINRLVKEETLMTNQSTGETFLLKKNSGLSVAANVMHFQPEIWGEDAAVFNARRFLPTIERARTDAADGKAVDIAATFRDGKGKLHSGAFRSFGGGNNVCPGRQFAQTEMQSVVALLVAGFEIDMPDGGQYVPPPFRPIEVVAGMRQPARDVQVKVKRREGYENVEWVCEM